MNTHRFSKMKFTRKPSFPKTLKHNSRQLGNMYSASSTVVTTSEASSTQSSCARNGKRNSCRCCNQKYNAVTNIHEHTLKQLTHDDCSYNGVNYGLCDNSSGCFMATTQPDISVCCKSWTINKGCNDMQQLCISGNGANVTLNGCSNEIKVKSCSGGDIPQTVSWEPAYFFSGGDSKDGSKKIPYDKDDLLKQTPSCGLGTGDKCKKRSGADPSCGASDFATLSTCILGKPLSAKNASSGTRKAGEQFPKDTSRTMFSYPAQDMSSSLHNLMKALNVETYDAANNGTICYTTISGETKHPGDANGTVQFVSDVSGKVPVLAHGTFGNPLSSATCTSDIYVGGPDAKNVYFTRMQKLAAILGSGSCAPNSPSGECLPNYASYVTYYKTVGEKNNYVCLITKKAFVDAGLETLYKNLGNPNNGGVGIAWGHGVGDGACGSFSFLKQGETFDWPTKEGEPYKDTSYNNNVVLLAQIGMRAWSGEWNDSIGTQIPPFNKNNKFDDGLNGASQVYITENLPYNNDSATCLQPLMADLDARAVDKLLDVICPTLPLNRYGHDPCKIPQQNGICTCVPNKKDLNGNLITCVPEQCQAADNKNRELCDSYGAWACGKWTEQNCNNSGKSCTDISDCNTSDDITTWCGSCSNNKCQGSQCIAMSGTCNKDNPNSQCCDSDISNIVCRQTDGQGIYMCQIDNSEGGYSCDRTTDPKHPKCVPDAKSKMSKEVCETSACT